jgi:hypothetical protein
MQFHVGQTLPAETAPPDPEQWIPLASPSSSRAFPLAALAGIAALLVLLLLIFLSAISADASIPDPSVGQVAPWHVALATLIVAVPAHEAIHAAFYPGGLLSKRLTYLIYPRKLTLAVYYEGLVSRSRWMIARLAPFLFLAVAPTLLLLAPIPPLGIVVETILAILLLVNALGSGGDLLSAAWVLLRVPRGSTLGFFGGKAYTRRLSSRLLGSQK